MTNIRMKKQPAALKRLIFNLEKYFWRLGDQVIDDIRKNIVDSVLKDGKTEDQKKSLLINNDRKLSFML